MRTIRHQRETGGPRLTSGAGAWTYTDPAEHQAALQLDIEHGINLAAIDDWIDSGSWPDQAALARVLAWRAMLLECQQAGNGVAAEGWGMFLLTLVQLNVRRRLAVLGAKSSAAHAIAAAATRKLWPNDINKIKAEYARRLGLGEQHGAITDLAAQYEVSTKTISRHVKPKAKGK